MLDEELHNIWNEYCSATNSWDCATYSMDEFDEIMRDEDPTDIALKIFNGDFSPNHEYFKFDGYANLESADWIYSLVSQPELKALAEYIVDNNDYLYNWYIKDLLAELEEEEEGADE